MDSDLEDNDDEPIGRVLTRREIIALFGATGAAIVAGTRSAFSRGGDNRTYLSLVQSAQNKGTPTVTPTATGTGVPTGTPGATGTLLPTGTATATGTGVPTSTATATGTVAPTGTATASATGTPGATATGTANPTATADATNTPTATGTADPTATGTAEATATPSTTPTRTPTGTAVTPTATPTVTATPSAIPTCVVRPEQTEGPYFVDELLNRSDIRIDPSDGTTQEGVLLSLRFNVTQITPNACTFLQGVYVDVWHCNAFGKYSDVASEGTAGKKYLRGYQVTNALGAAEFLTVYPGWYSGRTVHIHFKIRTELNNTGYDFTSQLYFDDTLTDQVFLEPPYNTRGTRTTRNNNDGIYQNGGSQLMLTINPDGNGGYAATFNIGLAI